MTSTSPVPRGAGMERRLTPKRAPRPAVRPHSTHAQRQTMRTAGRAALGAKAWKSSVQRKYEHGAGREDVETPIQKLRRIVRSVSIISGICVVIRRYAQKGTQMEWETIQNNLKLFAEFDSMVAFNFNTFGNNQAIKPLAGERLQRVMSQPPEARTFKDVQAIQWLLRENDTFQGYPLTTQIELCKCVGYRRYEARRIVVRQGHQAEAFYILLSGTVICNLRQGDTPTVRDICAGGCFGEQSLLEGTARTYTVVCKTDVELVTVMKEDFERIIKGPQLQQKERHLEYLRSLPLFEHFPVEKLQGDSNTFYHKYIRKGREVASTNHDYDYIIIIQSGSCQVVTDVSRERARPRSSVERRTPDMATQFPEMFRKQERVKQQRAKSADVLHWRTGEMRDTMKANILTGNTNPDRLLRVHDPKAEMALNWIRERRGLSVIQDRLEQLRKQRLKIQSVMAARQDQRFTVVFSDRFAGVNRKDEVQRKEIQKGIGRTFRRISYAAKTLSASPTGPLQPPTELEEIQEVQTQTQRPEVQHRTETATVQLATLGAGAVFGLEGLFQGYPTPVRLVSEGAECIFLSKKVFLRHCGAPVLQRVSDLIVSYPTPEYIQDKIQERRNWDRYKKGVMKDLVIRRHTCSALR